MLDDAIARRDFEDAAAIAASMPSPADHRNAMIRIHNAAKEPIMQSTSFDLSHVTGTIHYNPRRELHGPEKEPAATLTFSVQLKADDLAMFHSDLRSAFYFNPHKPVNGGASPVDDANDLRFVEMVSSVKWNREIVGGDLTLHKGLGGRSDVRIPVDKVDDFRFDFLAGGIFELSFRVACKPDERQSGALAMMQDTDREFSFESPKHADLAEQGEATVSGDAATAMAH